MIATTAGTDGVHVDDRASYEGVAELLALVARLHRAFVEPVLAVAVVADLKLVQIRTALLGVAKAVTDRTPEPL